MIVLNLEVFSEHANDATPASRLEHAKALCNTLCAKLTVSERSGRVGVAADGGFFAGLTITRPEETEATILATARNLLDALPELLKAANHDLYQCLSEARVSWDETHAGINILGLTVRTYELSVTY